MSHLFNRISGLLVLSVATTAPLQAQNLLQQLQVPGYSAPAPMSPYQKTAKWDYRFDPQYQSTIKPYLRWYMRYDPSKPGNRTLPRDFGFGMKYGYAFMNPAAMQNGHANYFSTCGSCGYGWGTSDFASHSDPNNGPSLYWNHLRYLSDVYGTTPIRRGGGELRNEELRDAYRDLYSPDLPGEDEDESPAPPRDDLLDSAYRGRIIAERTIWVAANGDSPNYSILYHEPPEAVADQFIEAQALLGTGAKIVRVNWIGTPPPGEPLKLIAGRLTSQF